MPKIAIANESGRPINKAAVKALINYTCGEFEIKSAAISVAFVTDEQISRVHKEFMNDDTTTDVISFNLSDDADQEQTFEMVVNADMAARISDQQGTEFDAELLLYVLHGLLHNIGFDDLTETDYEQMHETENRILDALGYGRVFGDNKFEGK